MGGFHGGHGSSGGGFHGGGHHSSGGSHSSSSGGGRSGGGSGLALFVLLYYIGYGIVKLLAYLFGLHINERRPMNWKQFLGIAITATSIVLLFIFFGLPIQVNGRATKVNVYTNRNLPSYHFSFYDEYTSNETEYYTVEYEMYGMTFSYEETSHATVHYGKNNVTRIDYGVKPGETIKVNAVIGNPNIRLPFLNIVGYIIASLALIVAIRFYYLVFKEREIHDTLLLQIGDINGDGKIDDNDIIEYDERKTVREAQKARRLARNSVVYKSPIGKCSLCGATVEANDKTCPICGNFIEHKEKFESIKEPKDMDGDGIITDKDIELAENQRISREVSQSNAYRQRVHTLGAEKKKMNTCPLCDASISPTDKSCPICGWKLR